MLIREKSDKEDNFIEIDLSEEEHANIIKGRYPSGYIMINGKKYIISIGIIR